MGTKSHIAIERENGAVESIRCQYDGYPAYNGALLLQHYNTPDRVNALIGLGNITYLAEELEPTGVPGYTGLCQRTAGSLQDVGGLIVPATPYRQNTHTQLTARCSTMSNRGNAGTPFSPVKTATESAL